MEIMVIGADGFTGWPITCKFLNNEYNVVGIDNLSAREYRAESAINIESQQHREKRANEIFSATYKFENIDITNYETIYGAISEYNPDTIINVAQIPSAPYSMSSPEKAWNVQRNNIHGSLNIFWSLKELQKTDTHVIQMATMGEYPEQNNIPEGWTTNGLPFPKEPGSIYHASKVNTTTNTMYLSQLWDIPTTEIYQGVIFGFSTPDLKQDLQTRFDVDTEFGTVVNRFVAQASSNSDITVYGTGNQKRALLPLEDCTKCVLLLAENEPSEKGYGTYPYRPVNQFQGSMRVIEIAKILSEVSESEVIHIDNPRDENESKHDYSVQRKTLDTLGYKPNSSLTEKIVELYNNVNSYKGITDNSERPNTSWI